MIVRIRLRTQPRKLARFVHPVRPAPRTAILVPGFEETSTIRVFPGGWSRQAERFRPASIAAPLQLLRKLAAAGIALEHTLIALTYQGEPGLNADDRAFLWEDFGVPVYEQVLGRENQLLAAECDAHNGLHLVAGSEPEHVDARLETEPCGCGNPSPRIARIPRIHELVELLA